MDAFARKTEHTMYTIFRIIIGLLFAMHGMSKLGWLGGTAQTGLMAFVGVGEFLVGLGVLLGLFVRLATIGGAIIMVSAIFKAHIGTLIKTMNPIAQGSGELVFLFLAAFLIIFAMGAGKFSLNHVFFKREML